MQNPSHRVHQRHSSVTHSIVPFLLIQAFSACVTIDTGTLPSDQIQTAYDRNDTNRYPIQDGSYHGFMDQNGRIVIQPVYAEVKDFSEGLAAVRKPDENWGYIDLNGRQVIQSKYPIAQSFSCGRAWVKQFVPGNYILINRQGKELQQVTYTNVYQFSEGFARVQNDGYFGFHGTNESGQAACNFRWAEDFHEGMAAVALPSMLLGFLDTSLAYAITPRFYFARGTRFSDGLAAVAQYGKYGYIDMTGLLIIEHKFDSAGPFHDGRALVMDSGNLYYINREGRIVSRAWVDAAEYSEGLGLVKDSLGNEELWGFIDTESVPVLLPQYQYARPFKNGRAFVVQGQYAGYIDRTGRWIWQAYMVQ